MRHNNKINHLGRTYAHREALLSNMAVSLIKHKRIFTTLAKAKELRKYVEPLITKSKTDTTHSRRIVFSNLRDKYAVTELFNDVSQKIGDRPGGYTRIIKTGNRLGDNAETCFIELVDYNELMLKDAKKTTTKTRRSRRGAGTGKTETTGNAPKATAKPLVEEVVEPVVEEVAEPIVEEVAEPVVEETAAPEVAVEEAPAVEAQTEEGQAEEGQAEEAEK